MIDLPPFTCHVVHVRDGDTWDCADGVVVRPARIDAPEMPGHCRPGRHCAPGDPFEAKAALIELIYDKDVYCTPVSASPRGGSAYDRDHRIVARCNINGIDVGEYMVAGGFAIEWPHK